jgi:ATP-dependent Zn protease
MRENNHKSEKDSPDSNKKSEKNQKKKFSNPFMGSPGDKDSKGISPFGIWAGIGLLVVFLLSFQRSDVSNELSYSDFKHRIRANEILTVHFSDASSTVTGTLLNSSTKQHMEYRVNVVREDPQLMSLLEAGGVEIKIHHSNPWLTNLFFAFLSPLIFVFLL